jgi:hypothetical protein
MNKLVTLIISMMTVSLSHAAPISQTASVPDTQPVTPTPSIYKQVDADGNISYSDTPPNAAAETLEMEPLGIISMPKPVPFAPTKATAAPVSYERLSITSPSHDSTYQNLSEPVRVSAQLAPSLQKGHTLTLLMDGRVLTNSGSETQVENIERGSHVFSAQVQDANGKVLITSQPVTIHVHRTSVINQKKQNDMQ